MSSSVNDLPSQFSSGLTLGSDYKASTPTSAQFSGAASASGSSASPGHKPGQRPSPVGSTFKSNSSAPSPTISAQGIKEPFGGSGPVQNIATTLTPPPSAGTNLPPIFVPGVNSVLNSVTSKVRTRTTYKYIMQMAHYRSLLMQWLIPPRGRPCALNLQT